jgi:hypothetical protein
MDLATEINIETPETADPRYEGEMCFEVEFTVSDPTPRWSGSLHTCPSDIDWYGEAAQFAGWDSVRIFDCTIGEGGDMRDANPYERGLLDKWTDGEGKDWFEGEIEKRAEERAEDDGEAEAEYQAEMAADRDAGYW